MIEMALAKSEEARKHIVRFETTQYGFDFYFSGLSQAQSFSSFISRIAPVSVKKNEFQASQYKQSFQYSKLKIQCIV